ncbi:MAG: M15 family metallopeptidase [Demequinaceae bacterium]|nr:M15 family metallopeptidase [Demequinaceae bacterium]
MRVGTLWDKHLAAFWGRIPSTRAAWATVGAAFVGGLVLAVLLWPAPSVSPNPSPSPSPSSSPTAPLNPSPSPSPSPSASPSPTGFDKEAFSIDDPTSKWVVVNKSRPLDPLDYASSDMSDLSPVPNGSWQYMRTEAADALRLLYAAAKADGVTFTVATAERTYGDQRVIYRRWVDEKGQWWADRSSARAGYSEHQTGWALDIYDTDECRLQYCFSRTPAGKWVAAHAWEYGFILRYPEDSVDITGFIWEPWHLRYVGVELSSEMHATGIETLEEFFGLPAAPTY